MKPLAIVIPAYKVTFFERTLASIARQTCKEFTLYVGNDCSSEEIGVICEKYANQIDIVYHRFEMNLGGKDLVAQWERCIDMTQGEPWIWLFSDDDIMGERCVELFLQQTSAEYDLWHFDVCEIDDEDNATGKYTKYPHLIDSFSYYKKKMLGRLMSFVVENIFSREVYNKCGGFQNFDLAWGSDTATWVEFSERTGMCSIPGDFIYWRNGTQNISPTLTPEMVERKLNALMDYFKWSVSYYQSQNKDIIFINVLAYIKRLRLMAKYVKADFVEDNIEAFMKIHSIFKMRPLVRFFIRLFV